MTDQQEAPAVVLAPQKVRAARRAVCDTCEFKNTVVPMCNDCKCLIPAKVMLANTDCPQGKWPK